MIDKALVYGSRLFQQSELEKVRTCMQCGVCSGGCPSSRRTAYRSRLIILKALLGLEAEVLSDESLWDCTTCYTCQERCPRGIKVTDVIRILRNLAVKAGFMLKEHVRVCELLYAYGHAVPINEEVRTWRRKLGLSEVPHTVHMYPEALSEVRSLLQATSFIKTVRVKGNA